MRIAVLVSGNGTNLQALLDAQAAERLAPATIELVISNTPGVRALERASAHDVPSEVLDNSAFARREHFDEALMKRLAAFGIDAVVLAGFMRILGPAFVEKFENRIINTHPALCPAFPGLHAPRQALAAGVKVTGCTVHFVDAGVDTGPIIAQTAVDILPGDTEERLHSRIQAQEHRLLPEALQLLASGALRVAGRRVEVDSEKYEHGIS